SPPEARIPRSGAPEGRVTWIQMDCKRCLGAGHESLPVTMSASRRHGTVAEQPHAENRRGQYDSPHSRGVLLSHQMQSTPIVGCTDSPLLWKDVDADCLSQWDGGVAPPERASVTSAHDLELARRRSARAGRDQRLRREAHDLTVAA